MASSRTTVSIQKSLYETLNMIAQDLELSSSIILELAIEQFVREYQNNRELLQKINAAYDHLPDNEEQTLLNKMKIHHKSLVEGQW